MYGDTTVIRALARALRDRADEVRAEADRLVGQADATRWTGLAADSVRRRARERAGALRRTAALHEDAADALDAHAAAVDRVKELVAAAERRFRGLVEDAVEGLAGLLDRFDPPPPGHRDWLDVDLRGARR